MKYRRRRWRNGHCETQVMGCGCSLHGSFLLAHTFKKGQHPNCSRRIFITRRAISLLCGCSMCFQVRRPVVSIKGVVSSQLEMPDRGCSSVSAVLCLQFLIALWFYLGKEEKTHLLRKSRVQEKKRHCWHRSKKQNASLGKQAAHQ